MNREPEAERFSVLSACTVTVSRDETPISRFLRRLNNAPAPQTVVQKLRIRDNVTRAETDFVAPLRFGKPIWEMDGFLPLLSNDLKTLELTSSFTFKGAPENE